jgi:hypothetical protein
MTSRPNREQFNFGANQRLGRAVLASIAVAIASSGCSLLNPYVRAPELESKDSSAAGLPTSALPQNQALISAVATAAAQRTAYYNAVSDRAKLRNGLPLALIPLSAVALYKGIASGGGASTRELLLKEGLVGAGLYGLASYYTSTTREQVYLAGAKALSCSIYATTPYYLPDDLAPALSVTALTTLRQQLGAVESTMQEVREARDRMPAAEPSRAALDALIRRAATSVATARKILRQAVNTDALLIGAGARLRATVESIVAEVDTQVARLEPDPAVILTLASSLPANAKQFAPGGTFSSSAPAPAAAAGVGVASISAPVANLPVQVNQLDQTAASLQFALDVIAQRIQATPKLETCQVQSVKGRIDVSPSDDTVEMKVGETRQFVVHSTVGIPSVEWVGAYRSAAGTPVEMTKQVAGNTLLVQITYSTAVEGISQATFEVSDSSQELKKQVTLNLSPGAAAAKDAPKNAAPAKAKAAAKPNSKPAVKNETAPAATTAGPMNSVERALNTAQVKALQTKLGVPATGLWDTATRAAITQWQVANKSPTRDGQLQTATLADIMK